MAGLLTALLFLSGVVAAAPAAAPATAAPATAATAATVSTSQPVASLSPAYWILASDGGVYQFGTASFGSLRGTSLAAPIVAGSATADGEGYWLAGSDGGVFSFGDAHFHGSTGGIHLNQPIVGMATDPVTGGYWLVARDGGVFSFDAPFFGSTGAIRLNQPIVGMAVTPDGLGYWLVARDGGVFSFGDARFHGSTGGITLNKPIVGMAADPRTGGYWLVASDGGIFSFGAPFYGSTGAERLSEPIVDMAADPLTGGYWMTAGDGGVFAFHAPYLGSTGADPGPAPVIAMIGTAHGYPFPPGGTGYDVSVYQCAHQLPAPRQFAIVQVAGAINGDPNPCYAAQAAWAASNMSAYIFMDGLPGPAPSTTSYSFGYLWARHWVNYSRQLGINPKVWWLDIETDGKWGFGKSYYASNSSLIAGAVSGLGSLGVVPGIYSTSYQWAQITGDRVSFPRILLWVPGAGNLAGAGNTAGNFCSTPNSLYEPFADGIVTLVQFGYAWSGAPKGSYSGPASADDQDYACP